MRIGPRNAACAPAFSCRLQKPSPNPSAGVGNTRRARKKSVDLSGYWQRHAK